MAATFGDYALGAGQGALGGATAGASFGAVPGAIIGGVGGGILGLLGAGLDAKQRAEMEKALQDAEAAYQKAQNDFQRQVLQSGAAAQESVRRSMAAKGAADQAAIQSAMSEAEKQADRAGLIGAERADFVAQQRQAVEAQRASSSPAVFQQALGGARQQQQLGLQRAGMALQAAQGKYESDVAQISGQQLGTASGAIGQALGAATQVGSALRGAGIDPLTGQPLAATTTGTGTGKTGAAAPSTGRTLAEGVANRDNLALAVQETMDERLDPSVVGNMQIGEDAAAARARGFPEPTRVRGRDVARSAQQLKDTLTASPLGQTYLGVAPAEPVQIFPGQAATMTNSSTRNPLDGINLEELLEGFASGGVAGLNGPQVAMMGEEGPELVLNAKQTKQLAQALPPGSAQRMPTVSSPQALSSPLGAAPPQRPMPPGPSSPSIGSQSPEELEAYLQELIGRLGTL